MKKTIIALFAVQCAWLSAAHAVPAYDRTLEEAAKKMVAQRIGEVASVLRGTFEAGRKPEYSTPQPRPHLHSGSYTRETWYGGLEAVHASLPASRVAVDRVVLTGSVIPQN